MTYSFKKSHSRILSILLVMTMLVTMLAGCKGGKPEDETTPSTENNNPPGLVEVKPTETETQPPETTAPVGDNMAVVKEAVSVRSGPSSTSSPIGILDEGTKVEILRQEPVNGIQWALIREGWVAMEFLEMVSGSELETNSNSTPAGETKPQEEETNKDDDKTTTNTKGIITAKVLNIRSEANGDSKVVGSYVKGDAVTILETKNGWGRTNKGWISMKYVNSNGAITDTTTNSKDEDDKTTTNNTGNGTAYFITASKLNIRSEASTNGSVEGSYVEGDRVIVLETKNGWGRTNKGWISLNHAYKTGAKGNNPCKGIVTATTLNIRSGPGTGYDSVGSLKNGARVNVLERITVNGKTWGCVDKGWISLEHVYVDGTTVAANSGTGTVTGNAVNIRSGPGTNYGSVGSLNQGDTVKILNQVTVGDMIWGCIEKGWISMTYVNMN